MYAIVKTGGKQYRVEPGRWLLVERLTAEVDAEVELRALLVVDGEELIDGDALSDVTVTAKVLAHERGPKLRIVKFKPKRGYKRRNGHRQELTRIEVTKIGKPGGAKKTRAKAAAPKPVAAAAASSPAGGAADAGAESEATNGA